MEGGKWNNGRGGCYITLRSLRKTLSEKRDETFFKILDFLLNSRSSAALRWFQVHGELNLKTLKEEEQTTQE